MAKNKKYGLDFAELLPPLSTEEFNALRADIKENGVRDAVIVDEDGNVLDGKHRLKIDPKAPTRTVKGLTDAEKQAFVFQVNFSRRNLSSVQKREALRTMKSVAKSLREEDAKKNTQARVARLLGVARNTVSDWFAPKKSKANINDVGADNADNGTEDTDHQQEEVSAPDARITIPKTEYPKIIRRLERGDTQAQVAADYGVKQPTIAGIWKKHTTALEEAEKRAAEAEKAQSLGECGVIIGDFRDHGAVVSDGSVDLIFTDPPYNRETLPQFEDLAKLGARVLKDGGSLITYLGDYQLPEVLALMTPHLKFWWPLVCCHTGPTTNMTQWGVIVKHKMMLWFVKGSTRATKNLINSLTVSERNKDTHAWQQGLVEATYYIENLTAAGGMVVDPYCGGATTAVAAKKLGRQFVTFEISEQTAMIARKRIVEASM